jgi:hypothetical protein
MRSADIIFETGKCHDKQEELKMTMIKIKKLSEDKYPMFNGDFDDDQQVILWIDFDKKEASIESSLDYGDGILYAEDEGTLERFTRDLAYLNRSELDNLVKELSPAVEGYLESYNVEYCLENCNDVNKERSNDILKIYEENSQHNQEVLEEEVFNNLWDELKLDETLTQNWIEENIDSIEDMNTYELQTEWKNKIVEEYGRRKSINSCLNYNDQYIYEKLKDILYYYKGM